MLDAKWGIKNVFPIPTGTILIDTCPCLSFLLPSVYYPHVMSLCFRRSQWRRGEGLKRLHPGDRVRGGVFGEEKQERRLSARSPQEGKRRCKNGWPGRKKERLSPQLAGFPVRSCKNLWFGFISRILSPGCIDRPCGEYLGPDLSAHLTLSFHWMLLFSSCLRQGHSSGRVGWAGDALVVEAM